MALIKCQECGKEISDTTKKCIYCGATIAKIICPECKTKNPIDEKNCIHCGFELKSNKSSKGGNKFIIYGGIAAIGILLVILLIILNAGRIAVPNLYNISLENAQTILTNNGLIPNIEYDYDDSVAEGNIISSEPSFGDKVKKNGNVTIIVSKGPSHVTSQSSIINWTNVSSNDDDWNFTNPYIKEGYLYIECTPKFGRKLTWKDDGYGQASINDTFDKTIPVAVNYENKEMVANKEQNITLKMSVNDLDVKKPTTLYLKLYTEETDISINFSISW